MKAKVIKTGEMVDVYHEPQHGQVTSIYKESVLVNGRMWSEDELDFCMKADEAPEKIYFNGESKACKLPIFSSCNIEYTRTDAFIEKATSYVQQHWIWNTKMIEDFINYMKGK